MKNVIVPEGR